MNKKFTHIIYHEITIAKRAPCTLRRKTIVIRIYRPYGTRTRALSKEQTEYIHDKIENGVKRREQPPQELRRPLWMGISD